MTVRSAKELLIYSSILLAFSIAYFAYAYTMYPAIEERETFLSSIGEVFGELGLWALVFVYFRTLLKLAISNGALQTRILPHYSIDAGLSVAQRLLRYLNRTHIYVGIATVAMILMHIALMGVPLQNLFFQAVFLLVLWQAAFGTFLCWRFSPKQLRKFSFLVHAQFLPA